MELSVVIPVLDEADCIGALLEETCAVLEGAVDFEIVVVDDGSSDGTRRVLRQYRDQLPCLRVLEHAQTCGQSAALNSGVVAARGQWVVTLDGDGQNDPADIMHLYEEMQAHHVEHLLVIGHRLSRRDSAVRRLASRIANGVRAALLRDGTPDTGCGIKLFARETWCSLPQFDHMHRFLPALVRRQGGAVRSLVVNHRERPAGRSKYGIMDRLRVGVVDLFGVWWLLRRYSRPDVTEAT